jgi:hypothetical protein
MFEARRREVTELDQLLQETTFRLWYIAGGVALLVLPMLGLSLWYHRNIGKTDGGRALMRRQEQLRPRTRATLQEVAKMARDIAAGHYGSQARTMQTRVYWIVALWIVALVVYFGVLLWADEMARTAAP